MLRQSPPKVQNPKEKEKITERLQENQSYRTKHNSISPGQDTHFRCGGTWPHRSFKCKAICVTFCGIENYFERMCFKISIMKVKPPGPVSFVNHETDHESNYEEMSSDKDEYAYSIKTQNQRIQNTQRVQVQLNNIHVPSDFLVNTDASINIIDKTNYKKKLGRPK